jgi:hypothetical protein
MSTYYPRRSFCLLKVAAVAAAGAALYHVLGKPHQCTASGCRQPGGMGASEGGPTFHVRDVAREEYQQRKAEVLRWKLDRLDRKRQEVMVALQAVQGTMTAAAAETGTATVAAAAVPAVRAEVPPATPAAASPTAFPLASPLHQEAMVVLEAGQAVQGVATAASSSAGTAAAVQRPLPVCAQVAPVEAPTMPTASAPIALPQASLAMPPQTTAPGAVGVLPVPGEVDPTPADFTQQS